MLVSLWDQVRARHPAMLTALRVEFMWGFGFQTDGTVNDALRWPSWHKELFTFLKFSSITAGPHKLDVVTVIQQAKQKLEDHFRIRTYNELANWHAIAIGMRSFVLYRSFQPE